ncbi:torsin-1A-like isoform X2 [Gambusia affinis]|uniref:torsin-1A-like isoform X2 n=1 Tax=Gambusia affinis TaxID=33528 RepID=UPI001CDC69FD|nr:torsin-1A-like isoform X2 [Gambusia affinis]
MKQYKAPLDRCMTTFTTTALSLRDAGFVPLFFVVLTQFVLLIEMQPKKQRVLLILLILSSSMAQMLDPSEIALAVGMAVGAVGVTGILSRSIFCYVKECCSPVWISFNRTRLETDLDNKLFGQHIASRIILKAVNGFMSNPNPTKPLVLSLHGWTGTGKNLVSQLIAESIYSKGMKSDFVHLYTSTFHFPHRHMFNIYQSQLQQWVSGYVTNCEHSLFIFDEMDKMQPGLIDSIKQYLEYYDNLDGVSYRKSIFIFLSNAGGDSITKKALEFRKAGKSRERITLKDLEQTLSLSVFNDQNGGFFHTSLIDKSLVDYFVPFLPLEKTHIVKCAMAEMKARNLRPNRDVADMVARDMIYFPKHEGVFSSTGCKTVQHKLNFYR